MGKTEPPSPTCARRSRIHDIVGAPLFRAESEVELARVLLEQGDHDGAERLLASADATASVRGAGLLTRAVSALRPALPA